MVIESSLVCHSCSLKHYYSPLFGNFCASVDIVDGVIYDCEHDGGSVDFITIEALIDSRQYTLRLSITHCTFYSKLIIEDDGFQDFRISLPAIANT